MSTAADIFTATGLTIASAGQEYGFIVPIGAMNRGTLTRLYVVQTSGTLEGFTYALYCDGAACPPGASPSSTATVPQGLYNLVPKLTVASSFQDLQGSWPADGVNHLWQPYSTSGDGRNGSKYGAQQLYVAIQPAGAGTNKIFAVSVTILHPVYT